MCCDLKHRSVKTDNFHQPQTVKMQPYIMYKKMYKARLKDEGAYYVLSESFRCGATELKSLSMCWALLW